MLRYQVVLVNPNKTERLIGSVDKLTDVNSLLNDIKYEGTWLTTGRKLLRYGRGEIQIREEYGEPRVVNTRIVLPGNNRTVHELLIEDHPELQCIAHSDGEWLGLNCLYSQITDSSNIIFRANSFTALADLAGKDLTYECFEYYENNIEPHNVKGVS